MSKSKAVLNFKDYDASGLAVKGQSIFDNTNANPNYPSCVTYTPILQSRVTNLTSKITAGGATPLPTQTAAIHAAIIDVREILTLICALVNWDAKSDEVKLLSSSFDVRKATVKNAKTFTAKLGLLSGQIMLEINSYGSAVYYWEISSDPIDIWSKAAVSSVSKVTIQGLTPGTKYWFRVRITKGTKEILVSDFVPMY